jgi:hypothetical protein
MLFINGAQNSHDEDFFITMDGRGLSESYSIHLNSITPDLSFLYNIVNAKLMLYLGVGVDVNICWPTRYKYKLINSQTGFVYRDGEGNIPLELAGLPLM